MRGDFSLPFPDTRSQESRELGLLNEEEHDTVACDDFQRVRNANFALKGVGGVAEKIRSGRLPTWAWRSSSI
jgi:hypothetical protein